MNAAPSPVPVSSRQARWRFAVLVAVLAGFFLMHGLSAGDACAEGSSSVVSTAGTTPVAMQAGDAAQASTTMGSAVSQSCECQDMTGAMCVASRSSDAAALLAMLLAGSAALPSTGMSLDGVSGLARESAGRRSRAPVPVRVLACVSRT